MRRWILMLALGSFVASTAHAKIKRKPVSDQNQDTDFSKHFDQEVQYDKDHPKTDDASSSTTEQAPAPKKKRASTSHRKRKSTTPPPDTTDKL